MLLSLWQKLQSKICCDVVLWWLLLHDVLVWMWGAGGDTIYGGPFIDEVHSRLRFNHRGLVACANAGTANTNNSQFFITLDRCDWLDKKNTIFGKVWNRQMSRKFAAWCNLCIHLHFTMAFYSNFSYGAFLVLDSQYLRTILDVLLSLITRSQVIQFTTWWNLESWKQTKMTDPSIHPMLFLWRWGWFLLFVVWELSMFVFVLENCS